MGAERFEPTVLYPCAPGCWAVAPVTCGSCWPVVTIRVRDDQRFPMPCGPSAARATSGPVEGHVDLRP